METQQKMCLLISRTVYSIRLSGLEDHEYAGSLVLPRYIATKQQEKYVNPTDV